MAERRELLSGNRLVTLTGAGGSGKTRLAIQVAGEFGDDVGCVDLAPITDQDLVPVAVSRALGLPDQPGRSTMGTVVRFIGDRSLLMVLDNCEHLLESTADLSFWPTVTSPSHHPTSWTKEALWITRPCHKA